MAAVVAGVSAANTGNNAALTTGTFASSANDLLVAVAVVSGQASGGTFTDNESGSAGWDNVTTVLKNTSADSLVFAIKKNFDAGSASRTVTFTPAGGPTSTGVAISVLRVTGMKRVGLGAVRVVGSTAQVGVQANQASGTPTPVLPASALTGNPTICAVGDGTNPAGITPNASWNEKHDTGYNTPPTGVETNGRDSGFTGTSIAFGGAAPSAFCSVVVELDVSTPLLEEDEPVNGFLFDPRQVMMWG